MVGARSFTHCLSTKPHRTTPKTHSLLSYDEERARGGENCGRGSWSQGLACVVYVRKRNFFVLFGMHQCASLHEYFDSMR